MYVAPTKQIFLFAVISFWCSCRPNENSIMKIREVALSNLYHGDSYYHLYMVEYNGSFDSAVVDSINQFVVDHYSSQQQSTGQRMNVNFMEYDPTVFEALNTDKDSKERIEWYNKLLLLSYDWKDGAYYQTTLHRRGNKSVYEIIKTSPFDSAGADQ